VSAEHPLGVLEGDVIPQVRELIESRERIPEAAFGVTSDRGQSSGLDFDALETGDLEQMLLQQLHGRPAKVEALSPGHDRLQDLVSLGRGQDEDDVVGRLFECLQ
jgi:hypothetical protein